MAKLKTKLLEAGRQKKFVAIKEVGAILGRQAKEELANSPHVAKAGMFTAESLGALGLSYLCTETEHCSEAVNEAINWYNGEGTADLRPAIYDPENKLYISP